VTVAAGKGAVEIDLVSAVAGSIIRQNKQGRLHMNEELSVSRRQALFVAGATTAIGVVAVAANAGDSESKQQLSERSRIAPPLKLKVTLTDGQIVTLNAAELVIDYGEMGQLLVKPNGFLPARDDGNSDKPSKNSRSG
jgi:hypothetical protein